MARKKVATTPFDAAAYIETPEDILHYLEAAFEGAVEDNDPGLITVAIGHVARSKGGIALLAEQTGLGRESLYKTLGEDGNPKLDTLLTILRALKLQLTVKAPEPV